MKNAISRECSLEEDDLIVMAVQQSSSQPMAFECESLLGKLRIQLYSIGQEKSKLPAFERITEKSPLTFLWVKHFPLFEVNKEGNIQSCHHPFTSPLVLPSQEELNEWKKLDKITSILSSSCDLVLHGNEVGGGYVFIKIVE